MSCGKSINENYWRGKHLTGSLSSPSIKYNRSESFRLSSISYRPLRGKKNIKILFHKMNISLLEWSSLPIWSVPRVVLLPNLFLLSLLIFASETYYRGLIKWANFISYNIFTVKTVSFLLARFTMAVIK